MQLKIQTARLTLIPFTIGICQESLSHNFTAIKSLGIYPGKGWPDEETIDTLPRIIKNLNKVGQPSGFESWMIIENERKLLIGDIGFKGLPNLNGEIDLGYGIIENERKKGFAIEASSAVLQWAFEQKNVSAITASCHTSNFGSQKILSLLNFSILKKDDEMIFWKRLKLNG